jgi:hypothetical protein
MADPYIKVTYLGKGWGVRLFHPDGRLHSEGHARAREMIGPVARDLLRWWDKCLGPYSQYADKARHRTWGKALKCTNEQDKALRNKDMGIKRNNLYPLEKH